MNIEIFTIKYILIYLNLIHLKLLNIMKISNNYIYNDNIKELIELRNKQLNFKEMFDLTIIDRIFPHTLLKIYNKDLLKIKEINDENKNYIRGWNWNFYFYYRNLMLNLLNKKHESRRDNFINYNLKYIENAYFITTSAFYILGGGLLFNSFHSKAKVFNIYIGLMFIITGKIYSMWFVHKYIDDIAFIIKKKYNKDFNIHYLDVLDETIIEDWKCYLYWYNLF